MEKFEYKYEDVKICDMITEFQLSLEDLNRIGNYNFKLFEYPKQELLKLNYNTLRKISLLFIKEK